MGVDLYDFRHDSGCASIGFPTVEVFVWVALLGNAYQFAPFAVSKHFKMVLVHEHTVFTSMEKCYGFDENGRKIPVKTFVQALQMPNLR